MSRASALLVVLLLLIPFTLAKDKKPPLPADVLRAETVFVEIAPDAGEPVNDAYANRRAADDVEKALTAWGHFRLLMEPGADLIITVRKGTGQSVNPTIAGGPIGRRPGVMQGSDDDIRIGGRQGNDPNQPPNSQQDSAPHVQNEIGASVDTFEVHRGGAGASTDDTPVWRYVAKDGLRAPSVPAVEQFRKAFEESEKIAAKKKP